MVDFLILYSSERRNNCLALLESAIEWLKKLRVSLSSLKNHKVRISKAPNSKIYPDFLILISHSL